MPANERRRRLRALATNLALMLGTVVTLAVVAEVALQFSVHLIRPRVTRIDPVVGWSHNSSISMIDEVEGYRYPISYNSRGYRGPDYTYSKPEGVRRVVIIGDSFVDGSEVGDDELFSTVLEGRLDDVQVINLGVYGYQTTQEYLTLEREGLRYDPDLVILVTVSNDLYGNVAALESFGPAPRFMLEGDSLRFEGLDHPSSRRAFRQTNVPVPAIVHRKSLLYYLVNRHIYQRLRAERITEVFEERRSELDPAGQRELYRRIVTRIDSLTRDAGAELIVVLSHQRDELQAGQPSRFAEVADSLRSSGVQVVDLYEPLLEAETSCDDSLFFEFDIHWSPRGHAAIAGMLETIVEEALDPSSGQDPRADALRFSRSR